MADRPRLWRDRPRLWRDRRDKEPLAHLTGRCLPIGGRPFRGDRNGATKIRVLTPEAFEVVSSGAEALFSCMVYLSELKLRPPMNVARAGGIKMPAPPSGFYCYSVGLAVLLFERGFGRGIICLTTP